MMGTHTTRSIPEMLPSQKLQGRTSRVGRRFSCRRLKLRVGDVLAVLATKVKAAVCAMVPHMHCGALGVLQNLFRSRYLSRAKDP